MGTMSTTQHILCHLCLLQRLLSLDNEGQQPGASWIRQLSGEFRQSPIGTTAALIPTLPTIQIVARIREHLNRRRKVSSTFHLQSSQTMSKSTDVVS
jgi:hypothetical protein